MMTGVQRGVGWVGRIVGDRHRVTATDASLESLSSVTAQSRSTFGRKELSASIILALDLIGKLHDQSMVVATRLGLILLDSGRQHTPRNLWPAAAGGRTLQSRYAVAEK